MVLKSLSIVGLYGALNLDVRFNEDITLLVGINGSGKTNVLNVIDWLLKPDFRRLAVASYESLALSFTEDRKSYKLIAKKTATTVTLSWTEPYPPSPTSFGTSNPYEEWHGHALDPARP